MITKRDYIKGGRIPIIGIYKIISPSGRVYIGQSWDIARRWNEHRLMRSKGIIRLENSIKKYGADAHVFEIIHELPPDVDQSIVDTYEILYTYQYKLSGSQMLNIKIGGRGGKHSEDTKEKLRIASTGRIASVETRDKIRKKKIGTTLSDQSKQKISIANSGKIPSIQTRAKMSASSNHTKMTEDHKSRLIEISKRPKSEEVKRKISESVSKLPKIYGRTHSEYTKQKLREQHLGKKQSIESSNKKREAMKTIWASITPEKREARLSAILNWNELKKK